MKMRKINWKIFIICFAIVYSVALAGSLFTDTGNWYESIKPSITPPNYIFPIVWNILFFLIATSLYLAWTNSNNKQKGIVRNIFAINLFLNLLWSVLFFGIKNPKLAFFELLLLEVSILFIIKKNYSINKISSYLLIPYALWVAFAGYLNYLIAFG